ncbi:MAG: 4-alpha-glucanotransferase [Gemmatimonadota bacterium]|nr:4-alpha-glucanotransferase [Gemmatimonadota bacterium]
MSFLHELSALLHILPEYIDQTGRDRRVTSDATRVDLLHAMGIDASSEHAAREALARLRQEHGARCVAPVYVARGAAGQARTISAHNAVAGDVEYRIVVTTEDDRSREATGSIHTDDGAIEIPIPGPLLDGYHRIRVELRAGAAERQGEQILIVTPARCLTPNELLGDGARVFGITANLYSVRSEQNWGVGDFSDLRDLATWGGSFGAAFVGVNPLHALHDRDTDISPYSPISRLFRNVIYIDVEQVPEAKDIPREFFPDAAELESLRASDRVRYDEIIRQKRRVLDAAFAKVDTRAAAFREYVASRGRALDYFATWMALSEHFAGDESGGRDWRVWPAGYRDPRSADVASFRRSNRFRIDLHCWLQFEADRQLEMAGRAARDAHMRIGIYQDLAVGSSPAGSDAWAYQSLFARGVSLGAPPDEYARQGQNWGLPPLNPLALSASAYRYFIMLVQSAFRHAGALRIDHVLGFFRQFWIPDGKSGNDGAYVRFPTHDLFGILALESHRARALVVGEDLGTVPPEVPGTLKDWGILSSKVMQFEREGDAHYKPGWSYEPLSLTTANTHDMATIAGWWAGHDIELRRHVGLLEADAVRHSHDARNKERHRLLERLAADGILAGNQIPESDAELRGAIHEFVCRTPAALVGIALDDIAGELEPVNVPGVTADKFPSWTKRMSRSIESLRKNPEVATALKCPGR